MFIAASNEGKVKEIGEKVSRRFDANEHHLFCRSFRLCNFQCKHKSLEFNRPLALHKSIKNKFSLIPHR